MRRRHPARDAPCADRCAPYVSTGEALDEPIAFGWIDGIRRKRDDTRTMQLISARKQQSRAQSYKDRAARLMTEGRMHPSGQTAIDAARAQGKWNEIEAIDALAIPLDLEQALNLSPVADEYFLGSPPSYRRNVLRWLHGARGSLSAPSEHIKRACLCLSGPVSFGARRSPCRSPCAATRDGQFAHRLSPATA